jgi:N-acyl-D-aspartate/D-glutamate deacylase
MASDEEHVDTLIKGARVIDGTGAPAVQQDVAVKDGRIVAIGELSGWTAENVVEAESFVRRRCCRRYRRV